MKSKFYNVERSVDGCAAVKEEHIQTLFDRVDRGGCCDVVRIVLFSSPANNEEYVEQRDFIARVVAERYGDRAPVWSLVAQPPLEHRIVAEVWRDKQGEREYKRVGEISYIVCRNEGVKRVMVGGIQASLALTIAEQSQQVCQVIKEIVNVEQMNVSDIVRQWNYIEQITADSVQGQHYQLFNDARSELYNSCDWSSGYPAATGIGTIAGGVMIDLDIISGGNVTPIDNPLQVAAHVYSKSVLIGENECKTTPKFERAKLSDDLLYISGTAAIRGEESLTGVDAAQQSRITLENIEELLSIAKCSDLSALRVYIKRRDDYAAIRKVVECYLPSSSIYLFADICRDELLVEIEGVAYVC